MHIVAALDRQDGPDIMRGAVQVFRELKRGTASNIIRDPIFPGMAAL